VEDDDVQICDCLAVFGLKNILVDIQLKSVVPEIRIREVFDCGMGGELTCAVGFDDFFAALPVVYCEGGTGVGSCVSVGVGSGVGIRFDDFIHHVNRPGNSGFFMEYRPFCSIGSKGCCLTSNVFLIEVQEVSNFGGVGGVGVCVWCYGGGGRSVVKALDIVMHCRPLGCGISTCVSPHLFDFFRGFPVVFGVGDGVVPFLLVSHHRCDDFLGVKMLEMLMD